MRRSGRAALAIATAIALPACKPDLGAPISLVAKPRILAVRGTPPEVKEGANATYDLLAVDASGTIADPGAFWALCRAPRPPSESNGVSAACLTIPDDAGPAPTFQIPLTAADPDDPRTSGACAIFGPLRPPADPTARPRDPDVTGGFYQPVRALLPGADSAGGPIRAFALERIQCRLANAPIDLANQFNNPYDPDKNPGGYSPNQNPVLAQLTLTAAGAAAVALAPLASGQPAPAAMQVTAGQRVTLTASWPAEVAETFPVYDLQTVTLVPQREALRVAWFVTAGELDHDATGRDQDDPALSTANDWLAPLTPGPVHLWLVLRDSRGGVDFAEFALEVTP
jgi:hypothetical protein